MSLDDNRFLDCFNEVKRLRREGKNEESIPLLMELVESVEADAAARRSGVAPWYYEQLAIVYRKLGRRNEEIHILQRYAQQPHARGSLPPKLLARLARLQSAITQ